MWSTLKRGLFAVLVGIAGAFVIAYAGDWAVFHFSGSPCSTVTVNRYLSVPLKGNKEEFDFLGSSPEPCSVSLFPHEDRDPCWLLRRNPNKWDAP
jgi:hypothetical protein